MPTPRPLDVLRREIDRVDEAVVALLNERARLVLEVGRRKAEDDTPVYAPHREQAVLAKVLALNQRPGSVLLPSTLEAVYRELMSGAIALERPLRIGYLGPPGSFSMEAAMRQFGQSVTYENLRSIDGVFEEVARGHVDYGLVPVENAIIGSVGETLEGFLQHAADVAVCAEVALAINHCLIAAPGAAPSDITIIASKPEALAQCRKWLAMQFPHSAQVPAASTSAAVEAVAERSRSDPVVAKHYAAIGSALAAKLSSLEVMFPAIQDVPFNVTRFLVLCSARTAAATTAASGVDKTTVLFVTADRPGALRDVLDAFAAHGVNLSHIEKRICPASTLATLAAASGSVGSLPLGAATGSDVVPAAAPLAASASVAAVPIAGDADAAASTGSAAAGAAGPAAATELPVADASTAAASPPLHAVPPSLLVPSMSGGRGSAPAPFVYAFFVEASGHVSAPPVAAALTHAAAHCVLLKVLGSFPAARRVL